MDRVVGDAATARHADHIAARDVCKSMQPGEGDPLGFDRAAGGAGEDHRRARDRGEHLVRPGEVQLRHARNSANTTVSLRSSLIAEPSIELTPQLKAE